MATLEIYKEQLKYLFSDCNIQKAKNIDFNEPSLKNAINNYNLCENNSNIYLKTNEKIVLMPKFFLGSNFRNMTFAGIDNYGINANYSSRTTFTNSIGPVIGFGLEFYSKRKANPISFDIDIFIRQGKHNSSTNFNDHQVTSSYKTSLLNADFSLKYLLGKKEVRPYFRIGAVTGYYFKTNSNLKVVNVRNAILYDGELLKQFKNFDYGLALGVGYKLKKISVEIRNESTVRSNNGFGLIKINSLGVYLAINLLKK